MARHVLKGPREMFNLRRVFAFWAMVLFLVGLTGTAHAQTVTLSTTGAQHTRGDRGTLLTTQMNYDDCEEDDALSFSVALTAYSGLTLQVWAGAGCGDFATRNSTTILSCWKVASVAPTTNNPNPFKIPVKDILYGRTNASGNVSQTVDLTGSSGTGGTAGTAGADSTAGTAGTAGTDAADAGGSGGTAGTAGSTAVTNNDPCTDKVVESGAQSITLFFMLVDATNTSMGSIAQWTGTYKLSAPLPPDSVSASIGENQLPLSFSYATTTADTTITGYDFFCDPPPGTAAAADAGVLPVDGGVTVPACTGSTKLVPGAHVNNLDAYRCGGAAGPSATGGTATGLVNGVAYNVAVATTDSYNNVGILSKVVCKVPQPVTGFYEAYTDAGGRGGGGFCSFSRHRETFALFALLGCASCLFLRRRRAA